jgi:hypothetical protein
MELNDQPDRLISVVTYFYESTGAALDVVQRLQPAPQVTVAGILGAAVMSRSGTVGTLKLDSSTRMAETCPDFETIFPHAILSLKAVGSDSLKASEHFDSLGFGVNLLKEIGENLPAGGAALVLVIAEPWIEELSELVGGHKGVERYPVAPGASLGKARKRSSQ